MVKKKRFALNVGMNWAAMLVGMVVPFFLMPFVVRHLGQTAYGVWILAVSTVSYFNLLDMGLRSAIVRFVSKAHAENSAEEARKVIGATVWFRALLAAVVAVLSVGLALCFPHFFKLPAGLQHDAQVTVLLCALGVASTLISGVFGGVLSAIHRFDLLSSITVIQTLARALGVLLLLTRGRGLVSLAYWELTVAVLAGIATCALAWKIYPAARVRFHRPHRETLGKIWSYSFKTFVIMIAVQIVFYTDNIVVGAFISVTAVTLYSIAGSLALYSGQAASAMGATFIPMASSLDASGQKEELSDLLIRGTQAALGLSFPITVTLLLRGKTFIGLWMGVQYSATSGTILQILLISQFFTIANATACQIAYGTDKHKTIATWSAVEAGFNLVLSLVLVKTIGLYGVAWGTAIAQGFIHLLFMPRFVHRELGVPAWTYVLEGWGRISLCTVPFAFACAWMDAHWPAHTLPVFFGQVLVSLPVYVLTVMLVFHKQARQLYERWQHSRQGLAVSALAP